MAIKKVTPSKKKKTSKKIQKRNRQRLILILLICGIGIVSGLFLFHLKKSASRTIPETPQHTMTKIPREVKGAFHVSATSSATLQIPILMYHYVEFVQDKRDTIRQSLDIIPPVFDNEVKTLQDGGYTFITPSDLANIMDGKIQAPQHPIILSFDDGYRDFYTDAFPILKKYNARAVAYIVPGFLDTPNYMFTSQLHEIAASHLVEIGAHTLHHVSLKGMNIDAAKKEITNSRVMLQQEFHVPVTAFAYPYGSFDLQAIQIVKDAGFTTAVSTIPGVAENEANRFFIYRIRPGGRVGDAFLNFIQQSITQAPPKL